MIHGVPERRRSPGRAWWKVSVSRFGPFSSGRVIGLFSHKTHIQDSPFSPRTSRWFGNVGGKLQSRVINAPEGAALNFAPGTPMKIPLTSASFAAPHLSVFKKTQLPRGSLHASHRHSQTGVIGGVWLRINVTSRDSFPTPGTLTCRSCLTQPELLRLHSDIRFVQIPVIIPPQRRRE